MGAKTKKRTPGRPTKFTKKLQDKIIRLLKGGNYVKTVCGACNIDTATFYDWLSDGRKDLCKNITSEFSDFSNRVEAAKEQAEINAVSVWMDEVNKNKNWKASMELLARRYGDRWSNTEKHEINALLNIKDVSTMTDQELQDVVSGKYKQNDGDKYDA